MSNDRIAINQWAVEDRPREKMLLHGVAALSNAELLAILIGSGVPGQSAVELMRNILKDCHDQLSELSKMDVDTLCTYKGIGQAKAITIIAASELGRRRKEEGPTERVVIRSSQDIFACFHGQMRDLPVEECWALLISQSMRIIDKIKVSSGGLTETSVDIRCVLREALLKRATVLALCHNHPSGNLKPSAGDIQLTERLKKSAEVMNIRLVDHVIVADGGYYSFADEGRL
jgi:DNA repair protein RadC